MAKLPPLFLATTLDNAKEHGLAAHALADNKGLLLFADGLAVAEQCRLLEKMVTELQAAQAAGAGHNQPQGDNSQQRPVAPSTIDCQVSVEERAQLFKFLTG